MRKCNIDPDLLLVVEVARSVETPDALEHDTVIKPRSTESQGRSGEFVIAAR